MWPKRSFFSFSSMTLTRSICSSRFLLNGLLQYRHFFGILSLPSNSTVLPHQKHLIVYILYPLVRREGFEPTMSQGLSLSPLPNLATSAHIIFCPLASWILGSITAPPTTSLRRAYPGGERTQAIYRTSLLSGPRAYHFLSGGPSRSCTYGFTQRDLFYRQAASLLAYRPIFSWWAEWESNPHLTACKAVAFPIKLSGLTINTAIYFSRIHREHQTTL